MDGPNVNLAFRNLLIKDLKENYKTTFIDIGTCPLHVASNAFGKLVKEIRDIVCLDQMAIDFFFFFKHSAGRREDFEKVSEVTGVLSRHLEKHCSSRWISLDKVLVKLIEQFDNLKEYFLTTLKTLPGVNGKSGIASTARYKRIKEYLSDKHVLVLMHFVASVSQDFQAFMKPLQSKEPMIHVLHQKCMDLIHSLLQRFVKQDKLSDSKYPNKLIRANEVINLKIDDASNHKLNCNFGEGARKHFKALDALAKKQLSEIMTGALAVSSLYLTEQLPILNQVVNDAKYLHPTMQLSKKAPPAIRRLALKVLSVLPEGFIAKEFKAASAKIEIVTDEVMNEFTKYQLERIPKSYFEAPDPKESSSDRSHASYWKHVYGIAQIEQPGRDGELCYVRIDSFWSKIAEIRQEDSLRKFPNLTAFVKNVLILSHGNADPERGFSINNHLLKLHGTTTSEKTIEALRIVKDHLVRNGGIGGVNISKALIRSCQSAHARYIEELAEKRRQEQATIDEARKFQEKEKHIAELNKIDNDLLLLKSGVEVAEKSIQEGNKELESLLAKSTLDRESLAKAHQKISMGMKRKTELQASLLEAEKKRQKLNV